MHLCWALSLPRYIENILPVCWCSEYFCPQPPCSSHLYSPTSLQRALCPHQSTNYRLLPENPQVQIFSPDIHRDAQTSISNYLVDNCFGGSHGQAKFNVSKKNVLASHWTYFFGILLVGSPIIHLATQLQPGSLATHPSLPHSQPLIL